MNQARDLFYSTFHPRELRKPRERRKLCRRVSKIGQNGRSIEKNQGWRHAAFSGGQWRDALSFFTRPGNLRHSAQTKRANVSHSHNCASWCTLEKIKFRRCTHSRQIVVRRRAQLLIMVIRLGH